MHVQFCVWVDDGLHLFASEVSVFASDERRVTDWVTPLSFSPPKFTRSIE